VRERPKEKRERQRATLKEGCEGGGGVLRHRGQGAGLPEINDFAICTFLDLFEC
jgi:hypothetical protein